MKKPIFTALFLLCIILVVFGVWRAYSTSDEVDNYAPAANYNLNPLIGVTSIQESLRPHPYKVGVGGPGDQYLLPGSTVPYRFTITNTGDNADTYRLRTESTTEWANTSGLPASITLAPGEEQDFLIPIEIPQGIAAGTEGKLLLEAKSETNPNLSDGVEVYTTISTADADSDSIADEIDNCPDVANPDQKDTDKDHIGTACDQEEDY